jgi:hypothetical protein
MSSRSNLTTRKLLWRSLSPSPTSFLLCGIVGFFTVVSAILLSSVTVGTSLPGLLDGQWAIVYTQNVVQPLTTFLSNNLFNKLLVAALWGLAGFIVYVGFEYVIHGRKALDETKHDIQMARGHVVEQPLKDEFWNSVKWRIGVIVGGILFVIIMQPFLHHATGVAPKFVLSQHLGSDSIQVAIAMVEWSVFWHGFVVFLRLYMQRTRIFGDDKLY